MSFHVTPPSKGPACPGPAGAVPPAAARAAASGHAGAPSRSGAAVPAAARDIGDAGTDAARVIDPAVQTLLDALQAAMAVGIPAGAPPEGGGRAAVISRIPNLPMPELRPDPATTREPRRPKSGLVAWRMKRVVAYVDAHLARPIGLADMANAAGLSRMHFAAQFRVSTGQRPHEYLLRRRIERAQQMLLETRAPLVDIALGIGFQTQAHFTTVFRRFVGDTPHQWRTARRGRN